MSTPPCSRMPTLAFCQGLSLLVILVLFLGACDRSDTTAAEGQPDPSSQLITAATHDAASLAGEVGQNPDAWLAQMRQVPAISATDAWSCVCGWSLQQGRLDQVEAWLGQLAGVDDAPGRFLALDEAEDDMPPHYARASSYGTAVAGCLIGLDGLLERNAGRARELIMAMAAAADQTLPPDWSLRLDRPTLFETFWPEALEQHDGARQAFLAQWRPPAPRLDCQLEVRSGWSDTPR